MHLLHLVTRNQKKIYENNFFLIFLIRFNNFLLVFFKKIINQNFNIKNSVKKIPCSNNYNKNKKVCMNFIF